MVSRNPEQDALECVEDFKNTVAKSAVEAFLTTYFTQNPDRLNAAPFGPYEKSDGTYVEVTADSGEVGKAVDSLYGGQGTKSKQQFIKDIQRLAQGKRRGSDKKDYECIWTLSQDDNLDKILPLRNDGDQGPPPPRTAAMTSLEFKVVSTLLAEFGTINYAGGGGSALRSLTGGFGKNYRGLIMGRFVNAPPYIAAAIPVRGQPGEHHTYDLEPPDSAPWATKTYSEIAGESDYLVSEDGSPLLDEKYKVAHASFYTPETLNSAFIWFYERIARNYPEQMKLVADRIAKKIWGDILAQERENALLNAVAGVDEAAGEGFRDLTKVVPAPKKINLTPTDFQCFLLENISKLTSIHKPDYKNIVRVDTNSQPSLVMNAINHSVGSNKAVEELLNLCPDVYGLLTPYIRISRVEYDEFGKLKPGSEKELKIPNFLSPDDIENITASRLGRAPGCGIKSFTWSLAGVQPAEVDNNITANLVMYFQTVNDFFASSKQAGEDEPGFLDLIIASPTIDDEDGDDPTTAKGKCSLDEELHRKYDGVNFRIKICSGWATPTNLEAVFPSYKGDIGQLKKAIDQTRTPLYLQQTRHLLTFNENGSVELSIDYQASLSGLLTGKTSDIFAPSSKIHMEDIEQLEEDVDRIQDVEHQTEDQKQEVTEKLEEIKSLREQDRLIKYKKLLKKLFASNKIYNLAVNPMEFLLTPYADLTPKGKAARAKRRQGETTTVLQGSVNQFELLDAVSEAASGGGSAAEAADEYSESTTRKFDCIENDPDDIVFISYFYLGDLLDNILEQIKENNDGKKLSFNFFLSEVEMIDPLVALQIKNIEDIIACGQLKDLMFFKTLTDLEPTTFTDVNGISQLISIGDIPISVDAFQLWFKNNVIKKDRDKYFFLHFVKDICAYLITSALKSKCFGPSLNFDQRFDALPVTLASSPPPGTLVPVSELARFKSLLTCEETESVLGLILISTDSKPKNLKGHFRPDLKRGIYHHYIGSACGLVKKINFNREDQAYLRESKIQKKGSLGPEQLRELYSATADLIGNNLYKNGNYIYISPLLFDASQKELDLLGLHGYYLVTSVKSTITPNSFDTSITALHEGIRFTQNELLRPLSYEGLVAESAFEAWWNTDMTEEEVRLRRLAEAREKLGMTAAAASLQRAGEILGVGAAAEALGVDALVASADIMIQGSGLPVVNEALNQSAPVRAVQDWAVEVVIGPEAAAE